MIIAFIGVLISLAFLIIFAYRGHSVVVVAPFAALIAVVFSGQPILASYTQIFMPALGNFIVQYFPLFLFGAIFGYLMTSTGLARYLAKGITTLFGPKRAMFSTIVATALLTYGGVSAWVVAFTIVPIATALFKEARIPKRLMPAAIALGTITFALAALPGSPQVHNAIPTSYFGTNVYAAPFFGLGAAAVMLASGTAWLQYRVKQIHKTGEEFLPLDTNPEISSTSTGDEQLSEAPALKTDPSIKVQGLLGLIPILVVIIVNFSFVFYFADEMDTSYLSEEKFGATDIQSLTGIWGPTLSLALAILVMVLMFPQRARQSVEEFSAGAKNAILPCFTTASEVGFGAVIASLAVFAVVQENMLGVSDNALVVSTVSTAVISGITGSSSGGLSITMETMGEQLAQLAAEQNISMELMHRVTAMASVSFDSMPHNGAVLTMLIVCGMSHRQSYKDIAVVTIAIPLITLLLFLGLNAIIPGLS